MRKCFDIAILGSGFAGSLLALLLKRQGFSVVLVEKDRHPRFVIGESSTPLANLYLERIARTFDVPELLPFAKYGSWKAHYPAIPVGKKRGFTFFWHQPGRSWKPTLGGQRAYLLVAASPHDAIADTHWFRPAFDAHLVELARCAGVVYLEATTPLHAVERVHGMELMVEGPGGQERLTARFVVDATGAHAWLARQMGYKPEPHLHLPERIALFAHFRHVARADAWLASYQDTWPYTPDDAAVHHMLEEGWAWVLHFDNGITSFGFTLSSDRLPAQDAEACWQQLLARYPSLQALLVQAQPLYSLRMLPERPVCFRQLTGRSWALLPSGVGILDPLLSTGIPLTLLGVWRLATLLSQYSGAPPLEALQHYQTITLHEFDHTARLIGGLWRVLDQPETFAALSKLYFAAASFRETRLRLEKESGIPGFLLSDHKTFVQQQEALLAQLLQGNLPTSEALCAALQPFDLAGLTEDRQGFYPARAEDALAACYKIPATREEVWAALQRSGFIATDSAVKTHALELL
jgi:FADH2 O2-dependent halogenase